MLPLLIAGTLAPGTPEYNHSILLLVLACVISLTFSFLCSAYEAVLLSLTPAQIAEISIKHPVAGETWRDFKARLERPISVILLVNTAAHTIGATLAGAQVGQITGDRGAAIFSVFFTYFMFQFTEILPKSVAVRHNKFLAPYLALPLRALITMLSPIVWFVSLVNRPFDPARKGHGHHATLEEIVALAGIARLSNLIGSHQERIIHGAARLSTLKARDVMIPIEQVSFLSTAQSLPQAIIAAHLDPHTRFPMCEGDDKDKVAGYVNFKEMIYRTRTNPTDPTLLGIIRPVHFARPDEPATSLFTVFVEQHVHMAVVRDAAGKTLGILTLEDIVEELVGEIEDEFDRLPRNCHRLSGGTWMVGGGFPIASLAQEIKAPLPDLNGTTSAWLIRRVGHMPSANHIHREGDFAFMVRRIRRGKIFEVAVTPSDATAAPA